MECCREENLKITEQRDDLVVKTCSVCGRRHFEFELDKAQAWTTI